ALGGDRGDRLLPRCLRRQLDRAALARSGWGAARECVATLGLARVRDAYGEIRGQRRRELEQPRRIAALELDFDFGERRAATAGADLANVQTKCRLRAIGERERQFASPHGSSEDGLVAAVGACEELSPRRADELGGVDLRLRKTPLELGATMYPAGGVACAFDGLQPARSCPAQPQCDACAGEIASGRVVIGTDDLSRAHSTAGDSR